MPVDQAPARPAARPPDGAKLVKYHDYIDQKIESTRRLVKFIDLATSLVALAIGVLLFLLVVVVLEHWVVRGGLSTGARWLLFGGLAAYVAYFAYRRLWPLCVHAINPVYAAQTIEHGSPALKNSLINLLMFRQRRSDISDAVYRTLEEQAAQGLTRVQVDASVDQSQLIRLGYVLIAVVAVAGLYKVFSPKDPLVAAERVLMPWANVVPASRVSITDIKPGVATVSRGEFVDVSADVRGLADDDAVVLKFTTDDGQVVGRAVPMRLGRDGLRFAGRLADEPDSSVAAGLTRNVTYWLEAGDARSLDYAITVVPAASMLVERVDYDYPAYTDYVDRSVEGVGDLRAIEGTRVTVHARANGVIREANVDFNADGRRDMTMSAADTKGHVTFELALRDDRETPRHASYVLRFTNDEGRANIDPVKHAIVVERDLDPEAAIRLPEEKSRDVRTDEKVAIEVDARDPDFALGAVRLKGVVAGREVVLEPLLKSEHRGKFTGRFVLTPSAHALKAGDVLEYWIEADDNRAPKPNTIFTARKVLKIVAPNPAQQPQQGQNERNEKQQKQQGENQQPQQGEKGGQQGEGQGQGEGHGQGEGQQKNSQQGGEGQQGKGEKEQKNQDSGQGQGEGQQHDGEQRQRQGEGETGRGGESKEGTSEASEQKAGEKSQGEQQSKGGKSGRDEQSQQKSDGEETGAGAQGGESSKGESQPQGARPDQQNGEQPNQEKSPVSSEGDNDAEAFDRIQKRLEESGELKPEDASAGEGEQQKGEQEEKRQGDRETGRQGESKGDKGESADGKAGEEPKGREQQQPGANAKDKGEGSGAETRRDDVGDKKEPKNGEGQQEKSPGGEQTASKGEAGDGNEQKSQGAPNSQEGMKPKEKPEQVPSQGEKTNQTEPPAGANSKKESDSHGDEGGDKAGGGEEGGGQKAPREGTGSAGANQSADNGAGQSGEKGKGENSSEGGQDAKSDKPTGESDGKTQGKGSGEREGQGDKEGGRQGDKETGRQGESQGDKQLEKDAGEKGEKDGEKQGEQKGKSDKEGADDKGSNSSSSGGGEPGGGVNQSPSITGEAPDGDAANLEYARKQTDLVVDKLADQLKRKKVDDKLLKELGWTEAELKRFVERWQQRKAAAAQNDEAGDAAKRELDDALRSLGLKRGELKQNSAQKDNMRDLREGYRGPVPPEYKERLKAYNQGVSRAKRDDE